jgi:hypothetical protein
MNMQYEEIQNFNKLKTHKTLCFTIKDYTNFAKCRLLCDETVFFECWKKALIENLEMFHSKKKWTEEKNNEFEKAIQKIQIDLLKKISTKASYKCKLMLDSIKENNKDYTCLCLSYHIYNLTIPIYFLPKKDKACDFYSILQSDSSDFFKNIDSIDFDIDYNLIIKRTDSNIKKVHEFFPAGERNKMKIKNILKEIR